MTGKKVQVETPSIKEAIIIADILDEAGFYKDASLMDEFIEKAAQHEDDLIKQAGIFSGIWNRLSGLAKRLFFKEYRQMYRFAKEANAAIGERMSEARKLYKEATRDFKNYELVAWREKVLQLPVYTKDLMVDYEKAFGRLVAFTYKLQEQGQVSSKKPGEIDVREITPPGEGGEGAGPPPSTAPTPGEPSLPTGTPPPPEEEAPKKKLSPDTRYMKERGWSRDPLIPSIARNDLTDEIAIDRDRFSKYLRTHIVDASADPDKDWFKLGPHKRQMPRGLKEAMGDRTWQRTGVDVDWVYLSPVGGEEKVVVPPEKLPEEPSLPKPEEEVKTKEDEVQEIAQQLVDLNLIAPEARESAVESLKESDEETRRRYKQKIEQVKEEVAPEEETPSPEPEVSKEEKETAERAPLSKEDLEKVQMLKDAYKNKVWAVYTTIKGKQRAKLVDMEDLSPQLQQVPKEMEEALFEALYLKRYKDGRKRVRTVEYPEVSKAELINRFLFHRG